MIEMIEKGKKSELEKTAKYYNQTVKSKNLRETTGR